MEKAAATVKHDGQYRRALLESLRASIREAYRVSVHPPNHIVAPASRKWTTEQQQAVGTLRSSRERLARSDESRVSKIPQVRQIAV